MQFLVKRSFSMKLWKKSLSRIVPIFCSFVLKTFQGFLCGRLWGRVFRGFRKWSRWGKRMDRGSSALQPPQWGKGPSCSDCLFVCFLFHYHEWPHIIISQCFIAPLLLTGSFPVSSFRLFQKTKKNSPLTELLWGLRFCHSIPCISRLERERSLNHWIFSEFLESWFRAEIPIKKYVAMYNACLIVLFSSYFVPPV